MDVVFLLVYVREAHALDSAWPMTNGPLVEDPVTDAEREQVASTCVDDLDLPMTAVIDRVDDKVNQAYGAWPDRLYLVGKDGKIVYAGAQGPSGFQPAEWEAAIRAELERTAPKKK
jgi:hypothetical protein